MPSLLKRPNEELLFCKHRSCVLLVRLEFSQKQMNSALFELVLLTAIDEDFVSLLISESETYKVINKPA